MKTPRFYTDDEKALLNEAAQKMPNYLIGGFRIDEAILGLHATLVVEDEIPKEQMWPRIEAALDALFSEPK